MSCPFVCSPTLRPEPYIFSHFPRRTATSISSSASSLFTTSPGRFDVGGGTVRGGARYDGPLLPAFELAKPMKGASRSGQEIVHDGAGSTSGSSYGGKNLKHVLSPVNYVRSGPGSKARRIHSPMADLVETDLALPNSAASSHSFPSGAVYSHPAQDAKKRAASGISNTPSVEVNSASNDVESALASVGGFGGEYSSLVGPSSSRSLSSPYSSPSSSPKLPSAHSSPETANEVDGDTTVLQTNLDDATSASRAITPPVPSTPLTSLNSLSSLPSSVLSSATAVGLTPERVVTPLQALPVTPIQPGIPEGLIHADVFGDGDDDFVQAVGGLVASLIGASPGWASALGLEGEFEGDGLSSFAGFVGSLGFNPTDEDGASRGAGRALGL